MTAKVVYGKLDATTQQDFHAGVYALSISNKTQLKGGGFAKVVEAGKRVRIACGSDAYQQCVELGAVYTDKLMK